MRGFVVRELTNRQSNYRSTSKLEAWLNEVGVTGIEGLDTRALTRNLRIDGAMKGVLSTVPEAEAGDAALVQAARRRHPERIGSNVRGRRSCAAC